MIDRRRALALLVAAAGQTLGGQPPGTRSRSALLAAARSAGVRLGAAMDFRRDWSDADLLSLMRTEVALLTLENGGKWRALRPDPDTVDWTAIDRATALADQTGEALTWHCVLWQNGGMPPYMHCPPDYPGVAARYRHGRGTLTAENGWSRLTDHLDAMARRLGDRFWRIDVANEMFQWQPARHYGGVQDPSGFRRGMWWACLGGPAGPDWLDRGFRAVHRRFPSARLVLNDWGHEGVDAWLRRKRGYILAWLRGAVDRGCPIDGVGLQSHLRAGQGYDAEGVAAFCEAVKALGLDVHITELDVDETALPAGLPRAEIDRRLAALAARHVETVARHGRMAELTFWHLRSDLSHVSAQHPGRRLHPGPFDAAGRTLPLYDRVTETLTRLGR